jgi:hypothetical protein
MEASPINKRVHEHLISKGYTWNARGHVDVYKKEGTMIFIYFNNYCFMMINNKIASQKEFQFETGYIPI